MDINWNRLQNGSDIRGVAMNGVEGEIINLTPEVVFALGRAFALWLRQRETKDLVVAVGQDSRLSGDSVKMAFVSGLLSLGVKVYNAGLASTPAMFMSTVFRDVTAGVMLTASHLPFNRNGLKFFTAEGGLEKEDIKQILSIASEEYTSDYVSVDSDIVPEWDLISEYSAFIVEYIRKGAALGETPLVGMKIVVDAGNGAGGFFATKVLTALGADVSKSQYLEPDGNFPNHIPNPEDAEAMASVCARVKEVGADLGIIFDTDVDRSAIVDSSGNAINRNALIALISSIILREHPGSTIVTDSITSDGLGEFIKNLGGVHHRYKRGYKNVINESKRLNSLGEDSWLAIETSGHAALRENYFLDDGAFLVAKILVEVALLRQRGERIDTALIDLKEAAESAEYRYKILVEDFSSYGLQLLDELKAKVLEIGDWSVVEPNYEGIRVACRSASEQGWFLLRMSLHDPVMPLNIESDVEGGEKLIFERLSKLLTSYKISI